MLNMRRALMCLGLSALCVQPSFAQSWPERPITIINSYPVGGAADVVTRIVLNELSKKLGQPVIIESKPGANSNIAADWVVRAKPDGYTLLVTSPWFAINQFVETGRRWNPESLTPIARFALTDNVLAVPGSSPFQTLSEYVEFARKQARPLQYGSPGTGSTQRMAAELFLRQAGIQMESVQYKGAPPIIPDLVSGRVSMAVLASANVTGLIKSGKLKGLATFGEKRDPNMPTIPTAAEQGYPKAIVTSWFGLHAPAGTPPEIIKRLSDAIKDIVSNPSVHTLLQNADAQEAYLNSHDFAEYIRKEQSMWKEVAANLDQKNE